MNTKLILGHASINVNGTGEFRIGNDATPIGSAYTAELYFTPTSDGVVGILCASTASLNAVGSDLTGGTFLSYLVSDWSSGQTFTMKGDVTALWAAGQKIIVYRFQSTYQSGVDCYEYTIASMSANGSDTDITISEASPGVTFRAGGLVGHLTRNIVIGKASATLTFGNYNTNRPIVRHASTSTGASIANLKSTAFIGLTYIFPQTTGRLDLTGCVVRNGYASIGQPGNYRCFNSVLTDCIFVSNSIHLSYLYDVMINSCASFSDASRDQFKLHGCKFDDYYEVNNRYSGYGLLYNLFKCQFLNIDTVGIYSLLYQSGNRNLMLNGNIGKFRHHSNTCPPTYDFLPPETDNSFGFYNTHFVNDLLFRSDWWGAFRWAVLTFDNHNGTLGDVRRATQWYRTKTNGDGPLWRSGEVDRAVPPERLRLQGAH
jgi:hypothetical protein